MAEATCCPSCGGATAIRKSSLRTVITLAQGPFTAREVTRECCANHVPACPVIRSTALADLVKSRQRFGYDLIVAIGIARYLRGKQRQEIRDELLQQYQIKLSSGSISQLCDRFLESFEALHEHRAPQLRDAMVGGYPLHIDATSEQGRGGLFVCMDGWHQWVLTATRITSEHRDQLRPQIAKTVALFGRPVATMRDLGEGMAGAVEPLSQHSIPDLICHYHFLGAVGKKLFDVPYRVLRNLIRNSKVRPDMTVLLRELRAYQKPPNQRERYGPGSVRNELLALVLWLLDGTGCKDAPFPFSVPHADFVTRCFDLHARIAAWLPRPWTQPEKRAIEHLQRLVGRFKRDQRIQPAHDKIFNNQQAFTALRNVLRLSDDELPRGDLRTRQPLLPALELIRLEAIKQAVDEYRSSLEQLVATQTSGARGDADPTTIILKYLERYGSSLFGHPARRDTNGTVTAVTARTNNCAEHFFGASKQRLRRRLGRARLARDLEQQPAQAALVANLLDPCYVRVVCGSIENLPSLFAEQAAAGQTMATPIVRDHRDKALQAQIKRWLEPTSEVEDANRLALKLTADEQRQRLTELQACPSGELQNAISKLFAPQVTTVEKQRDPRLPCAGVVLNRNYQGIEHQITVLDTGFTYLDRNYSSLSTIAKTITGTIWNGYAFFGLARSRKKKTVETAAI